MRRRPPHPFAPGLRRLVERDGPGVTALHLGDGARSVRGLEALTALEEVSVGCGVRLGPVARLPRLRKLFVGPVRRSSRDQTSRLEPLARAPALASLVLHGARVRGFEALSRVSTLREVELLFLRCPDLSPLAALPLRHLVLDGVWGVRLDPLRGLPVEELDLWGTGHLDGVGVLATMPNLREVWVRGTTRRGRSVTQEALEALGHLSAGVRVVLDGDLDPDRHRAALAALADRGVHVYAARDPHGNGVHPSWWGPCPGLLLPDAEPPRYVSPVPLAPPPPP